MTCHYCGTEITGREVFCRCCGTRLAAAPAPAPVSAPVACEPAPVPPQESPFLCELPAGPEAHKQEPLFDFEKAAPMAAPKIQLPTRRGLAKMIFLGILTLGIYPIVIWSRLVGEVNITASRYDGERSMSFFGMLLLVPFTLGIHYLVWMHKLCRRIGAELQRRGVDYVFGAKDFWLWNVLLQFLFGVFAAVGSALQFAFHTPTTWIIWVLAALSLLCTVGPLVFLHKLMAAMNRLNADFNRNG